MEYFVGGLITLWIVIASVAVYFICKNLSSGSININVTHENKQTTVPFNDLYDPEGDFKKEHTLEDTFNEVFKEYNELMTGEEMVKSDG